MVYCNKCNCYTCNCNIAVNNNIFSDQAGRDGLSAKQIKINLGQLPENASDQQFLDSIKGIDGGGKYLKTEW